MLPPLHNSQFVSQFTAPSAAWRKAALNVAATPSEHKALMADQQAMALHQVRLGGPAPTSERFTRVNVAAFNVERGRSVDAIAHLLGKTGIDIALLSEIDIGMVRSNNRDTVADIAAPLGLCHATAIEFIELGLGDHRESKVYAGGENALGLHGNAILSRWPIKAAQIMRLDDGGFWFFDQPDPNQRRIGARNALAALIDPGFGDVWWVVTHFESHKQPTDRGVEMERLCSGLDMLNPATPIVLGGDFNSKGINTTALQAQNLASETLFEVATTFGFSLHNANTADTTTRHRSWHTDVHPPRRLDWMMVRGLAAAHPKTHPALDPAGDDISDHDMISAQVNL